MERLTFLRGQGGRLARMGKGVRAFGGVCSTLHGYRAALVTLTYAPGETWEPDQIRACMQRVGAWSRRRAVPIPYLWVMELHRSGVPHYHIMFWLPKGLKLPMFDVQGWWPYGSTNVIWSTEKTGKYLAKYVSKSADGDPNDQSSVLAFPAGARLFGRGGLRGTLLGRVRWFLLPGWMRSRVVDGCKVRRLRGGFVEVASGVFWPSRFRARYGSDGLQIYDLGFHFGDSNQMEVAGEIRELGSETNPDGKVFRHLKFETLQPLEIHQIRLPDGADLVALEKAIKKPIVASIKLRAYKDRLYIDWLGFKQGVMG